MSDLTPEQSAALVAALENGGCRGRGILPTWALRQESTWWWVLTDAGRIVAKQFKQLADAERENIMLSRRWGAIGRARDLTSFKRGAFIEERKRRGLTQRKMAELFGVSQGTYARWELGPYKLPKVAIAFISYLRKEIGEPYWRPIAECVDELEDDTRYVVTERYGHQMIDSGICIKREDRDGGNATCFILYLGPNPVTVPAAPESEGT